MSVYHTLELCKKRLQAYSQIWMKNMSTVLEIIALGLSFVLVFKPGCVLELLGCFKQCARATSYTNYLRISRAGTQGSVILKHLSWLQCETKFQMQWWSILSSSRTWHWSARYRVEIYLETLEIWKLTNLNKVDFSQNTIYATFQWHINHSYWLIKYISKN